jgi:hypothetical protein
MRTALAIYLLVGIIAATVTVSANQRHSQIRSIEVRRPNIVVRGSHLNKVQIWAIPTGTGITLNQYTLLGNAKRSSAAGANEKRHHCRFLLTRNSLPS